MSPQRSDLKTTYDQYRDLPETGPRYQLIDGELIMSPAPTSRHQTIILRIASAIFVFVEKNLLGQVFVSPIDVILSTLDVLQPDVIFISNARRKIIAREGIRGAPDLCVEVLSKKTRTCRTQFCPCTIVSPLPTVRRPPQKSSRIIWAGRTSKSWEK